MYYKKYLKIILKLCIICIIFTKSIYFFEKLFANFDYSDRITINFYRRRDSEIFFLGSSHVIASIDAQIIETLSGRKTSSFPVLGEDMGGIYYKILEMLKNGKPKIIFIEVYSLEYQEPNHFRADHYELFKNRRIKYEMSLINKNNRESRLNFIFPLITRRKNIKDKDLIATNLRKNILKKSHTDYSFSPMYSSLTEEIPIYSSMIEEKKREMLEIIKNDSYFEYEDYEFSHEKKEYIRKIYELSQKYNFKLIYFYQPMYYQLADQKNYRKKHDYIKNILSPFSDLFLDFNLVQDNNFVFTENMFADDRDLSHRPINQHLSLVGALYLSYILGNYLKNGDLIDDGYDLTSMIEMSSERKNIYLSKMRETKDLDDYIAFIKKSSDYLVIVSSKDEEKDLWEEDSNPFKELGLDIVLKGKGKKAYIGIVDTSGKKYYERLSPEAVAFNIYFGDNHYFSVYSGGGRNISSIKIDGEEKSKNEQGYNLVVYDMIEKELVDNINIYGNGDLKLNITR